MAAGIREFTLAVGPLGSVDFEPRLDRATLTGVRPGCVGTVGGCFVTFSPPSPPGGQYCDITRCPRVGVAERCPILYYLVVMGTGPMLEACCCTLHLLGLYCTPLTRRPRVGVAELSPILHVRVASYLGDIPCTCAHHCCMPHHPHHVAATTILHPTSTHLDIAPSLACITPRSSAPPSALMPALQPASCTELLVWSYW